MMTKFFAQLLAIVAVLGSTRMACADSFTGGGGVFVGGSISRGKPKFTWGGELFGTHFVSGSTACQDHLRAGVGPLLQFAFRDFSEPRLTIAARAGGELNFSVPSPRLEGELGGTFFFDGNRFAVHTGLLFEYAPLFNLAVRHQLLQNDTSITAGFRYFPTYGAADFCILD